MSTIELESKVRELRELQALAEEVEAEMEIIKDEIKSFMGHVEEIKAGPFRVTWRTVTTGKIDTAALRKLLPDVAQQFTRPSTVRRFCVM